MGKCQKRLEEETLVPKVSDLEVIKSALAQFSGTSKD
jgi:hypothetical protein